MGSAARLLRTVRFADCTLDLQTSELWRNGKTVILQDQPFQILTTLLETPGQLVTREDLIRKLWPDGTFVDFDQSLNKAIARLREVLGDSAEHPQFVETLPRKGYRWIGQIDHAVTDRSTPAAETKPQTVPEPIDQTAATRSWSKGRTAFYVASLVVGLTVVLIALSYYRTEWSQKANTSSIRSLAVLPLENLSGDPSQNYFTEGMTDELITNLAMLPGLRVISRTSMMRYAGTRKSVPEIARELHVDGIVEGSVMRSADRVRVRVQLIYAPLDQHVWAAAYERSLPDVMQLQAAAASDIAEELRLQLTKDQITRLSRPRVVNPEAHEAYLMGRFYWNKRTRNDINTGLGYFQKAISLDPSDPSGYIGLADTYLALGSSEFLPPGESFPKARDAALKALAVDDSIAEAHSALGQVYQSDFDWPATEKEYKRALALNPNSAVAHRRYSFFLSKLGRHEEAISEAQQARELDPAVLFGNAVLGQAFYLARRYDESLQWQLKAIEQDPHSYTASSGLASIYAQKGMFQESISVLERVPGDSSGDVMIRAPLGYAYAKLGRKHDAELVLTELQAKSREKYISSYFVSWVCVGLGRNDEAMQWLERAYQQRDYQLTWLGVDPIFDPLRSDPRFSNLVHRIGLAQ